MSIQSRREKEKQARVISIKKAAWKIFLREGLHKSKIAEIAVNCNLGLSTLYYYFKDKRQLVYALMLDYKMEKHQEHLALIRKGISKKDFVAGYIDSYLNQMDHFRFFVLADSYYNFHGEYDLSDPVIQEYDKVTHENGTLILNSLSNGLTSSQKEKILVANAMIVGYMRRYALLPRISLPPSEDEREKMMATFLDMSLGVFAGIGVDLESLMDTEG